MEEDKWSKMGEHGLGATKVRLRKIFGINSSRYSSAPRNPLMLQKEDGKILGMVHV